MEMDRFPLRPSLFPNVPPYIRFLLPGQEYEPPLPDVSASGWSLKIPSHIAGAAASDLECSWRCEPHSVGLCHSRRL